MQMTEDRFNLPEGEFVIQCPSDLSPISVDEIFAFLEVWKRIRFRAANSRKRDEE